MSGDDLPFALSGSVLITGPSGAGKTRLTARALARWLDREGPEGVVVLDLGPEIERDGRIIGRRIDRFIELPREVWYGRVETRGPRAEGASDVEATRLAAANARRTAERLADAPSSPRAVFVNDVTLAAHVEQNPLEELLAYCDGADLAVVNAYEGTDLGIDDPISRQERRTLETLTHWADRVVRLEAQSPG